MIYRKKNFSNFKELQFDKSIQDKSNEVPAENLFDPIVLADIAPNELSESVWRLADQTDIDKDNQIFYVTYQDPNLGNKTVKLVNQVVMELNSVRSQNEFHNFFFIFKRIRFRATNWNQMQKSVSSKTLPMKNWMYCKFLMVTMTTMIQQHRISDY